MSQTREDILDLTAQAMLRTGFQGLRADKIIEQLGITKGALYHYFSGKQALAYAVFDERIAPGQRAIWAPLNAPGANPVEVLQEILRGIAREATAEDLRHGDALVNLTQEMMPLDEDMAARIGALVADLLTTLEAALARGRSLGLLHEAVNARLGAQFVLGTVHGAYSLAKATADPSAFRGIIGTGLRYIESFRT